MENGQPEDISYYKRLWYEVVCSIDTNISTDGLRRSLAKAGWNDHSFTNLSSGLKTMIEQWPEFFAQHDYRWVLGRGHYDFAEETLGQLVALQVLCGVWRNMPPELQRSTSFDNVCVRVTNLWNLRIGIPQYNPWKDVRFVSTSRVWSDTAYEFSLGWLAFMGLPRGKSMQADDIDRLVSAATRHGHRDAIDSGAVHACWRSILVKAAVDREDLDDELVAGRVDELIRYDPRFRGARVHPEAATATTLDLRLSALATMYAIAHEVGHALADLEESKPAGDAREEHADRFGLHGLWNMPRVTLLVGTADELPERNVLVAGVMFFALLQVWHIARRWARTSDGLDMREHGRRVHARALAWWQTVDRITQASASWEDRRYRALRQEVGILFEAVNHYVAAFNRFAGAQISA